MGNIISSARNERFFSEEIMRHLIFSRRKKHHQQDPWGKNKPAGLIISQEKNQVHHYFLRKKSSTSLFLQKKNQGHHYFFRKQIKHVNASMVMHYYWLVDCLQNLEQSTDEIEHAQLTMCFDCWMAGRCDSKAMGTQHYSQID